MKFLVLSILLVASTTFANQFSSFVGTYVPVAKAVDSSYGNSDCATYGLSSMNDFRIYEASGVLSFAMRGVTVYSANLVESAQHGQRFNKNVYISGDAKQAIRQEVFFDFMHDDHSTISLTISKLANGNYSLKYDSYFSNELRNTHSGCSSEVEVRRSL